MPMYSHAMVSNEFRLAVERRLAEIEAEAVHLRALVILYGGGVSAARVDETASSRPARTPRAKMPADALPFFRFLAERRDEVHMDEMEAFARERGIEFDRARVRQHMHNWKNRDLITNPAQSVFKLTPLGLDAVLADAESEPDSEDAERGDAPKPNEAPNGVARGASDAGEERDAPPSPSLWSHS
jgi:hypothetical protein